jgi:hypothetical protein
MEYPHYDDFGKELSSGHLFVEFDVNRCIRNAHTHSVQLNAFAPKKVGAKENRACEVVREVNR